MIKGEKLNSIPRRLLNQSVWTLIFPTNSSKTRQAFDLEGEGRVVG